MCSRPLCPVDPAVHTRQHAASSPSNLPPPRGPEVGDSRSQLALVLVLATCTRCVAASVVPVGSWSRSWATSRQSLGNASAEAGGAPAAIARGAAGGSVLAAGAAAFVAESAVLLYLFLPPPCWLSCPCGRVVAPATVVRHARRRRGPCCLARWRALIGHHHGQSEAAGGD